MAIGVHEVCVLDVNVERRLLSLRMDFVHGSQLEQDWLDRCDVDGMTSRDLGVSETNRPGIRRENTAATRRRFVICTFHIHNSNVP